LDAMNSQISELQTKVDDLTAGEIIATGQCGENIYYVLYDNGKLLLRGTGATYDYTSHDSVFYQNDQIKEIVLSNGITGLGDRLFYHCANAKTVSLPATLTSIGNAAFAQEDAAIGYTAGLTSVTIPQAVTAIQSYAFYHTAIAEVTVPASVKTWGKYVFSDCTKLKNARVACDSIGAFAFTRCTALSSLTISANCRTFGENMLAYCESLTDITYEGTIAQWNTITKPVNWMSSGEHSYNNYLKKIQCIDGYLEYDPENNVWNEVKNG
ncbi:leucine-rich repeat domain-containing protein, partial [Ruminococcus sp.]|uniref:leucine-rich repeat domain-containing protein n=1 Tax=Ruminococcus sp. TaxID=41978 RepID=UPI002E78A625